MKTQLHQKDSTNTQEGRTSVMHIDTWKKGGQIAKGTINSKITTKTGQKTSKHSIAVKQKKMKQLENNTMAKKKELQSK